MVNLFWYYINILFLGARGPAGPVGPQGPIGPKEIASITGRYVMLA